MPEVETIRKTLKSLIVGKEIKDVLVYLPKIIKYPNDVEEFRFYLKGKMVKDIGRRGKFLLIEFEDMVLVSHLRMEGRYGLYLKDDPVEKHTHIIFHFSDGTELRYRDVRQFGTMHLYPKGSENHRAPLNKLGPEPLDETFTFSQFAAKTAKRETKIKPLLLNQEFLAGLGNIYVDEALFMAGIHPERPASSLTCQEVMKLYEAIRKTLEKAIEMGGSSIKSYVNGQGEMGMFQQQLKVYGRKGNPCFHCGTEVIRLVVGGRGTHICPKCQK